MKSIYKFIAIVAVLILAGCQTPGAYEYGVKANLKQYEYYTDVMLAQQTASASCYAKAVTDVQISYCAILAAGMNASQTIGGRPDQLRIAKSQGEIVESVVSKGLDAAVKVYGLQAVSDAVKNITAIQAKDPLIVRPEVIQTPAPEVIFAPAQ